MKSSILRAAYFNIWRGGEQCQPLRQTAFAIKHARLNIVAIHEAEGAIPDLAQMTGLNHSLDGELLSAYPIVSAEILEGTNFRLSLIQLPDDRRLWVVKGHLPETRYGPYEVRKHGPSFDIEGNERTSGRVELIEQAISLIDAKVGSDDVLLLVGLNSPSHHDWTPRVCERNYGATAQWPVTRILEDHGYIDAYRTYRPDELAYPGYSWTPGYPPPKRAKNEKDDRLDYVFFRGAGLSLWRAEIVGEHRSVADIVVRPWPSDHRVVLGELISSDPATL